MAKAKQKYRVECRLICWDDDGFKIGDSLVFSDTTMAVSEKQAINNCRFRHHIKSQYENYDNGRELWEYEFNVSVA